MDNSKKKPKSKVSQELLFLLDRNPSEEEIHQFFSTNVLKVGAPSLRFSDRFIFGIISKFPITPDRVPDFVSARLVVQPSQSLSRLTFIELKKANSALYAAHGRMSKDLNDAWMECVETSRLMAGAFQDCLRRIVKILDKKRLDEFDRAYSEMIEGTEATHFFDTAMPWCNSVVVIGRRSSLDTEGIMRTRELSASTGRGIQVITYDTVVDWLSQTDPDYDWSMFERGWYW